MKSKSVLLCCIFLYSTLLPVFSARKIFPVFHLPADSADFTESPIDNGIRHFTTRNDTVVFHPEAFSLETNAKLNEFLLQIPGISLIGDELFWHGKQLSIKINEEEYFGGNGIISLIPCYVIKEITLFNSISDLSEKTHNNEQKDDYNLSINLWPSYVGKWYGDLTTGAQTPQQYEVGIDALRLDAEQPFIAFFNANNINKSTTPTQILNASSEINQYGRQQFGALSFHKNWKSHKNIQPRSHRYYLNATAGHADGWGDSFFYQETYLLGGNTNYDIQMNDHYTHLIQPTLSGEVKLTLNDASTLKLIGDFSYSKTESRNNIQTAQFSAPPFAYSDHPLKDVFSHNAKPIFQNEIINRESENNMFWGHESVFFTKAKWEKLIAQKSYLEMNASMQYTDTKGEYDSYYHIDYLQQQQEEHEQRYNENPSHVWIASIDVLYQHWFTNQLLMTADYNFSRVRLREEQHHYLSSENELEHQDMLKHPNLDNTFKHSYDDRRHSLTAALVYNFRKVSLMPGLTWIYAKEKAHHVRPHIDTLLRRNKPIWNPGIKVKWQISPLMETHMEYKYSTFRPNLLDIIPWVDNTNPLFHLKGNPNLHACNQHTGEIYFLGTFPNHQAILSSWMKIKHISSPITRALTYDKEKDIYIARPQNALRPTYSFEWNIDYQQYLSDKWKAQTRLNYFMKNMDGFLTGFSQYEPLKSNRQHIAETTIAPQLTYEGDKKFKGALYGEFIFTRNKYKAFKRNYKALQQYDYGVKMEKYFGDFQIRTALHDLIYKGYVNQRINGHHVLWSASAAWHFLKGKGKLKLSCDDILNNTLLYHREIEPHSHTEFYENKQHHFINLTFTYHFAP